MTAPHPPPDDLPDAGRRNALAELAAKLRAADAGLDAGNISLDDAGLLGIADELERLAAPAPDGLRAAVAEWLAAEDAHAERMRTRDEHETDGGKSCLRILKAQAAARKAMEAKA